MKYERRKVFGKERPQLRVDGSEQLNISVKYQGYSEKQKQQVKQVLKMESKKIPQDIDYHQIYGLRLEARQKIDQIRPESLRQVS